MGVNSTKYLNYLSLCYHRTKATTMMKTALCVLAMVSCVLSEGADHRRGIFDKILAEAAQITKCDATLNEAACTQCCDDATWGYNIGDVEHKACVATCSILGRKRALSERKRFLEEIFGGIDVVEEAKQIAKCDGTMSKTACTQCCDDATWGFNIGDYEHKACVATCNIFSKRALSEDAPLLEGKRAGLGDFAGELSTILQCDQTGSKDLCTTCCKSATWAFAPVEIPACTLTCSLL